MQTLQLNPADNLAIALADIAAGTKLDNGIVVAEDIPRGHKLATRAIRTGEAVRKLGQVIGLAASEIGPGAHIHTHNVDASEAPVATATGTAAAVDAPARVEFDGYVRDDGAVGTRNYLGIVSTVNCSATVVREIAARARETLGLEQNGIDGVVPITHTTGCGMTTTGEGMQILRRTLGGFIRHPNFAGVLVIGLGCEGNELGAMLESQDLEPGERLRTMTIQQAGGTRQAIELGLEHVRGLAELAARAGRQRLPASGLTLGLQCGGSDAFSVITANPALGHAADLLVAAGGTVILGETPEIHGAEGLLLARAASSEVADALNARLAWWQQYVAKHDATLNNNPSPGNLKGGITTIYEKSLGAVAKGGTSRLEGVFQYGEKIDRRGFVFMDSPGYDPCSVTGEIAAGANIVCFTTGRGSVFGAKPVPSVKLATNSELAAHMADDMDFNCGPIAAGEMSIEEAGRQIYELLLDVASGRQSASEEHGFGDFEFVPWQIGAVL